MVIRLPFIRHVSNASTFDLNQFSKLGNHGSFSVASFQNPPRLATKSSTPVNFLLLTIAVNDALLSGDIVGTSTTKVQFIAFGPPAFATSF